MVSDILYKYCITAQNLSYLHESISIHSFIQRKAYCRERIAEPSCARKGTVDIEIIIVTRKGDLKIMCSLLE